MYLVTLDCDYEPALKSYLYSTKEGAWGFAKELIRREVSRGAFPASGVSIYYYKVDHDKEPDLLWGYRFNKAEL